MGNDRRERQVPQRENDQATPVPRAGVIGLGAWPRARLQPRPGRRDGGGVRPPPRGHRAVREVARVAATPSDLAAHSDVVLVSVFNDQQVRAVLGGPDGVFAGRRAGHCGRDPQHHPDFDRHRHPRRGCAPRGHRGRLRREWRARRRFQRRVGLHDRRLGRGSGPGTPGARRDQLPGPAHGPAGRRPRRQAGPEPHHVRRGTPPSRRSSWPRRRASTWSSWARPPGRATSGSAAPPG